MAVDDLREHKDDHDPGKEIIKTLDQTCSNPRRSRSHGSVHGQGQSDQRIEQDGAQEDTGFDQGTQKPGLDDWEKPDGYP